MSRHRPNDRLRSMAVRISPLGADATARNADAVNTFLQLIRDNCVSPPGPLAPAGLPLPRSQVRSDRTPPSESGTVHPTSP